MQTAVNTNGKNHESSYFKEGDEVFVYRKDDNGKLAPACGKILYLGNYHEIQDPRIEHGKIEKSIKHYMFIRCADGEELWLNSDRKGRKTIRKILNLTESMRTSLDSLIA